MQPSDRPTTDVLSSTTPRAGGPRARRLALSIALGGGLALGVAGLAQAADPSAPSGSAAPSGGASASAPAGPGAGRGEARTRQPHLSGTVKSISATRIVIVDRDGFTRQINITSTPEGVAVGTVIRAVGTVNADGVSLDATQVSVVPARPAKGEGRPGGPGQRGEGGKRAPRGDQSAPPAAPGSASPSASATPAPSASAGS